MSAGFVTVPQAPAYRLIGARVPAPLLGREGEGDAPVAVEITIDRGRIAAIGPAGSSDPALPAVDLRGGMVLPRFVDVHTHLDKGHIVARSPNPDGGFFGAREAVGADREANWTADDVRARMDFAIRCAFAHGTGAIRTHIDSIGKQTAISWPVFAELREAWKGRMALQAVSLLPSDLVVDAEDEFRTVVDTVARNGGILGAVTFLGRAPDEKLDLALERLFGAAAAHGLDLDFHVDESDSADARSLEVIADAAIRHRFKGAITTGHCCSLALDSEDDRARVIDKLGTAGISVVSLPMCNMYLQDRKAGRTPRWRGVAPLHELDAAGIRVMVASDNTRDPFYAYGDLDMVEVFREATRILHFDHSDRPWTRVLGTTAADVMGLADHGRIKTGGPADLVFVSARTLGEFVSRPQFDRVVVVGGAGVSTTPPDYRELDPLHA